jgi:uncharacterized protein (DUF2235 family)
MSEMLAAQNPGRRLVVCLDGTWNSTANEREREDHSKVFRPTNTLKLCRAVLPMADRQQLTYYDIGVGALAQYSGTANRLLFKLDRLLGGVWGAGFEGNVEDALHFLTLNYHPGDDVFIFGFSRGAATARAVTRFLEWTGGLLPKKDAYYFPFFFREYIQAHGDPKAMPKLLGEINARRASTQREPLRFDFLPVRYLGVWDTVLALGSRLEATGETTSPAGRTFHTGKAPATCVQHARQALAVDEKRFDFRPELWTEQRPGQTMEQRWFPGVHSNIGGGLKTDGLANIALHWIVQGAEHAGLKIDADFFRFFETHPEALVYESYGLPYQLLDILFGRWGKGKRPITGLNAELDPSVLEKMRIDPKYRPENVLQYLASHSASHEQLPDDVRKRIGKLREGRG